MAPIGRKIIFGTKVISFTYRNVSAMSISMPVKTFIATPKTPSGSRRWTAAKDTDFQNPSTRRQTASATPKTSEKPKKCTVCHGTNQKTWLIQSSMAGDQPSFGSVGSTSPGTRISA